jgi:hypothetical protein
MATDINLGDTRLGCTDRIRLTIKKDGVAWTGIDSVVLTFTKPSGDTFQRNMVLESANIWYYDTTTTEIDEIGTWVIDAKATDAAVVKRYEHEIGLNVKV